MANAYSEQRKKIIGATHHAQKAFLAGGAINSAFTARQIEDYDFYFRTKEDFVEAVQDAYDEGLWCVHASHRSVTFADGNTSLQFMHFDFFDTAEKVFDAFDFTVCMGAFDTEAKEFILHDHFLTDCSERRLRFHAGTRFPIASALRVLKYQERGYSISREETLKLSLACAGVALNSWADLEHQIGGIYGHRLAIAKEGEFSVPKAIEAISSLQEAGGTIHAEEDDRPAYLGSAETLLSHLGFAIPVAA